MVSTGRRGLPEGFRFHDHYDASLLINSDADIEVVRVRLRHASAKTTLDTYGPCGPTWTKAFGPPLTRSWRPALRILRILAE